MTGIEISSNDSEKARIVITTIESEEARELIRKMNGIESPNDPGTITYKQLLEATKNNKYLRSVLKDTVKQLAEQYAKEHGQLFLESVRLEEFIEWTRQFEASNNTE